MFRKISLFIITLLLFHSCMLKGKEVPKDKVIVRFWHPFSADSSLGKTLLGLIAEFNKKHPEWSIKAEGMGSYSVLKQKLIASIIAGNQPEMSLAYEAWIAKFYKADKLVHMDEMFSSTQEWEHLKRDLFKAFLASCMIDNKLISMPFNKSVPVLYYNKNIFSKNSIKRPPRTWEEFIRISKQLTKDNNNDGKPDFWGIISRANLTDFLNFLKQNKGEILDKKGENTLFNKKEGVQALKFFLSWKYIHSIADFYSGGNPYSYQNDFTAGRCAMIIGTCVSRFFMQKKLTFPLGTAPIFMHKKKAV
ncbi:MAG: extracellular solute-binding protein, partial [Spirochaetes bacterium]|nr:extracellular solute-binding protein [Spirochaetota bacterium]